MGKIARSKLRIAGNLKKGSDSGRTQRAQRSKKFDLDRNFWSRSKFLIPLENFNLDISISPQKIGPRWTARLKISFSLEIFNLARNLEIFWSLGPLGTDFSRIFILEPPDFFADFVAGFFLLIFWGKSAQKNPLGESPAKSSKIHTTKIPDTFLQRGRGNNFKKGRFVAPSTPAIWKIAIRNARLATHTLTTHTPLIKEWRFTPWIKGVDCPKPLVLKCFVTPTPLSPPP